jgi:DNA-directed RNA polymerase subunit RPC12/RpoP
MIYRCPQCKNKLKVTSLFFHDISACSACGQKVVLGDFLAFSVAALAMLVSALTALYVFSHELDEYFVAAGYALSIGMGSGLVVLFLLGRATPFKRTKLRVRRSSRAATSPADGAPAAKT